MQKWVNDSGDEFSLLDDDEYEGHVVNLRGGDLAVLNDAANNLVGVFIKFQLVVACLDEFGLS